MITEAFFRRYKIFETRSLGVTFLSRHALLDYFCKDLALTLPKKMPNRNIIFYCGIHENFSFLWYKKGVRVALQTEQFCDAKGRFLWPSKNKNFTRNIITAAKNCDVFWDLSYNNIPYYKKIGVDNIISEKLISGPYIFPQSPIFIKKPINENLVFFGSINARRQKVLDSLSKYSVNVLENGTFGRDLFEEIDASSAVLNIHYNEGVFTEAPRLLAAFLRGRVLCSETLGEPFISDFHYVSLESIGSSDYNLVHENLAELVCKKFTMKDLIIKISS